MTELTDASRAFSYGDSILVGERVRLRGVGDDDLPTLAKWEMDPGGAATAKNRVIPPSEASAKEFIAKSSANERDDVGFAIETLDDPPLLVGFVGLWGARPKDRCAELGIALGREHLGRGYGTDATRVMVGYGCPIVQPHAAPTTTSVSLRSTSGDHRNSRSAAQGRLAGNRV
jgi:RimJ/RimL family protein N-acetyltransferase